MSTKVNIVRPSSEAVHFRAVAPQEVPLMGSLMRRRKGRWIALSGALLLTMSGEASADDAPAPHLLVTRSNAGWVYFDVNLEGGVGKVLERDRSTGFGRLRAGLLTVIEPLNPQGSEVFVSVGATVTASNLGPLSVGAQAEMMHLSSGFWFQGGGFVDVATPGPGWMAAAGWSLFGVELQRRFVDAGRAANEPRAAWAVYGKFRLPLTIISRAF
jgi:hypothetical protein